MKTLIRTITSPLSSITKLLVIFAGMFLFSHISVSYADFANSLSGLVAWYDSKDVATITKDSSGFVSQWNDKSPNWYNLTQTNILNRPVYDTSSGFMFDGINDTMSNSSLPLNQPSTIFAVFTSIGWNNYRVIYGSLDGARLSMAQHGSANQIKIGSPGGAGANFEGNMILPTSTVLNSYYISTVIYNTPNFYFRMNQTEKSWTSTLNSLNSIGFALSPNFYYGYSKVNIK